MIQQETSAARSYSEMRPDGDRIVAITGRKVMIAGGGPTGLMLAGELALARVDGAIVEGHADFRGRSLSPEPREANSKPMGESL
jgi:NADPH-dependent 2,4-dienoyl-CoA reductase/sulfur reductase-like enzyme